VSAAGTGGGTRHRVVIIGSGFGGLFGAKALKRADVDVTVISRTTHHLFQPLLYQVATGILSEGEIAPSTREVLKRQRNVRVILGDVTAVDLAARTVTSTALDTSTETPFDSLIVAAGAHTSYFGHDEWVSSAPGLKSIDDALEVRSRIFGAFEMAEIEPDPEVRKEWMTFVVVGAGPTGVEMAGQIAEAARNTLRDNFRSIDPADARVLLLDAADAVLGTFGDRLSAKATTTLTKLGIDVELGAEVTAVDPTGVDLKASDGRPRRIGARTMVWAAGVRASELGQHLAEQAGVEVDKAGRVPVRNDLTLPGHPEVFVIGDMATLKGYPGVSQFAMQGARHAAKTITARLRGTAEPGEFSYWDKGSMATVSRFNAVASIGNRRFAGFIAWLLWLGVHLVYLIGFKNRITTLVNWAVTFLGNDRSERVVSHHQSVGRVVMNRQRMRPLGTPPADPPDPGSG
jgi:NADH:ubiquinone reductase (H+-translocating)